jgi:GTP-binding protein
MGTRRKPATRTPPARAEQSARLIAIVGRPNVGKSALFNRLTGTRRSIVTNEPGITRDRIYGTVTWGGQSFELVDTGGMVPNEKDAMPKEIVRQAKTAIDAAAKLVLVADVRAGLTPLDEELALLLQRTGKPLVLAVNKVDAKKVEPDALPFHRLGIDPVLPLSAEHGNGVAELLEALVAGLPSKAEPTDVESVLDIDMNIAIIGRPNVGKSTLLNRLVGEERSIVSAEAGTTRDSVDTLLKTDGRWWRIVDTAGIRRKGKTKLVAEKLSVVMARRHLERADVAVMLIDATEGVTSLDATIAGYAHQSGRALVLAVNKWDAVEKDAFTHDTWAKKMRHKLKFLDYVPAIFISALEGQRVHKIREAIVTGATNHRRRLTDAALKQFLKKLDLGRTTVPGGRDVRISGLKQVAASPPMFVVHANLGKLHFSFRRFLENQLRERFEFEGTPLHFKLVPVGRGHRKKNRKKSRRK